MMGEIAKIKQPNESLYREENVLLCAAFSAAPFLLKTIMKRLLREITAGRTCFSPSYKCTHTHTEQPGDVFSHDSMGIPLLRSHCSV